jgi:hypothetical protein
MSDSPQPRRHMRRGGWIALNVVVVPRMMTWAQRRTDDVSWMRTHQADMRWMRTHGDDVRWMRNNADTCDWGLPRSRARYWMRTDPNAARPAPRSDNGSGWSTGHRDWMHEGWHDNYQRR